MRREKCYETNIGICVTRVTLDSMGCRRADTITGLHYLETDHVQEALWLNPFAIEFGFPKFAIVDKHCLRSDRTDRHRGNERPKWVHDLVLFFVKTVELVRIAMPYFVSKLVALIGKIVDGKDAGLAAA